MEFCGEEDVALTAYSPQDRGRVPQDETLSTIGERYENTLAQVALRWLLDHEGSAEFPRRPIPSSW